jgi:hypothetical protein
MAINWKWVLLVVLFSFGAYKHFHSNAPLHVLAVHGASDKYQVNGYQITPLEPFELYGRVLSRKEYTSDEESKLVPVDLAMGWGPMADTEIVKQVSISQSNRWYYWQVNQFPIPRREIETHSANMHLIPSTPAIEEAIKAIKPGQLVKFSGYLVEAKSAQGFYWKSSLTREDTGAGACELVLVKTFAPQ